MNVDICSIDNNWLQKLLRMLQDMEAVAQCLHVSGAAASRGKSQTDAYTWMPDIASTL